MTQHVTLSVDLTAKEVRALSANFITRTRWRTYVPEEDQLIRAHRRAQDKVDLCAAHLVQTELQES